MSACIAIKLFIVSRIDSPLDCDEVLTLRLITSAESFFAAISKVVLVLVLFSKNKLQIVFPFNKSVFLTLLFSRSKNESALAKISSIICLERPSIHNKC